MATKRKAEVEDQRTLAILAAILAAPILADPPKYSARGEVFAEEPTDIMDAAITRAVWIFNRIGGRLQ